MRMTLFGIIVFTLLEIGLLIWVGSHLGVLSVLSLILLTGLLGLVIGRLQGFETWNRARRSVERNQVPAVEMIDGLCIVLGAFLLIIPGFISDFIGLSLLIPLTRNLFKRSIANALNKLAKKGTIIYRRF